MRVFSQTIPFPFKVSVSLVETHICLCVCVFDCVCACSEAVELTNVLSLMSPSTVVVHTFVMTERGTCVTPSQCAHTGGVIQPHGGNKEIKAVGISQKAKLIQILQVDAADWRTFSAAAYEIGANWILWREQCD